MSSLYNENEVMKDIIVKAFRLDDYLYIMKEFEKPIEERNNEKFQKKFNSFYKVRREKNGELSFIDF